MKNESQFIDRLSLVAQRFKEMPEETVQLLKKTVAPGATDEELALFLYMAKQYDLDPLLGEIYFVKMPDKKRTDTKPTFIVSRDGYLKIAMRHPEFHGLNSFTVREGDEFEINAESGRVKHRFGAKRGRILGAWAIAYRKGYSPSVAFVDFNEYVRRNSQSWQRHPSAMIQKVAEVFVLRRQFNLSGLYIKEEFDRHGIEVKAPETEKAKATIAIAPEQGSQPITQVEIQTPENNIRESEPATEKTPKIYKVLINDIKESGKSITKGNIIALAMKKMKAGEITPAEFRKLKEHLAKVFP